LQAGSIDGFAGLAHERSELSRARNLDPLVVADEETSRREIFSASRNFIRI
jgi:hypothetical protein